MIARGRRETQREMGREGVSERERRGWGGGGGGEGREEEKLELENFILQ